MGIGSMGGRALDDAKIEAAYIGFYTTFQDRLKQTSPLHTLLSTVTETENVLDTQLWLSQVPKMRRWIGPKQIGKLRGQSQPIVTSPFEASIEVSKHDVIYDRLGLYKDRINSMADSYGWALDEMVIGMIGAGVAGAAFGTTYDGANLIDTTHKAITGAANQSNKVTGALSQTTYATAWQRFYQIKDENGNPINLPGSKMYLLVGPQNRQNARTIIQPPFQSGGATNIDYATAELIVHPRIDASTIIGPNGGSITLTGTEWALIPAKSAAILTQIRRSAEFLSVEEGEFAFRTGHYLYGVEAEFGAAYGLWQEIVGGPGV